MLKQLLLLAALTVTTTFAEEDHVLVLDDDTYEAEIAKHDMLLVEFYAPWCGHCKSLEPEYKKAAATLMAQDPPIFIAKVDATVATKMAEKYGIQGFPTLKLFKGSVEPDAIADFDGGRTADEIVKWMVKKSGPSVRVVETAAELEELKSNNDVVVVAYMDAVDGEHKQIMEKVADKDENSVYVATASKELTEGKTTPDVTLFKNFDEGVNEYDGEFTVEDITTFVKANAKPLIMTFSQEKASQIFGGDVDVHLLMFSDEGSEYHADFLADARHAATENKGKLLHIFIPLSEDRILDYFGFKEADLPAVMLVNMASGMKKFSFTSKGEELSATFTKTFKTDLLTFENEYFSGDLNPSLKSAEPVDDADEAVKVIVGKSFKDRVVDSDKDVLLEFYAPWCGHCKTLAPKYDELAEQFSAVESILIAKMDATENEIDHPGVDVQGFPTLIFFPAGDKSNPVPYEGERDVNGMAAFLKKNARTFDLDGESHGKAHDEL